MNFKKPDRSMKNGEGRPRNPSGIYVGGIYNLGKNRVVICIGMWWGRDGLSSVDLYEPTEDIIHERSGEEVEKLLTSGTMELRPVSRK